MAESTDELRRHEKVVAAVDLPGVPAGTTGKIMLVNGFRWIRYRVRFDDGTELGPLDRDQLARRSEWTGGADSEDDDREGAA